MWCRGSRPELLSKIKVFQKFLKIHRKTLTPESLFYFCCMPHHPATLLQNTPAQIFSCKFCNFFNNNSVRLLMVVQINFRMQHALLYIFIRDVVLGVSGGWPCLRINKNLKYKKQFKKLFELRARKNWYNFSYFDFYLTFLHEKCPYSKFSGLYFPTFGL